MSKLRERLEKLYRLAVIPPDAEPDDARVNEARTAAFLLLKTARENGVKIKFEVPGDSLPPPARQPPPPWSKAANPGRTQAEVANEWTRRQHARDAGVNVDFVEDFFQEVLRDVQRQKREDAARDAWREQGGQNAAEAAIADEIRRQAHQNYTNVSGRPVGENVVGPFSSSYTGRCASCRRPYSEGDSIYWRKGRGSTHERCGKAALL